MISARDKKTGKSFKCRRCGQIVWRVASFGSKHRNHCPRCLWSQHIHLGKVAGRQPVWLECGQSV